MPQGQLSLDGVASTGALFSPDRKYRYALWRTWDASLPGALFVGLNPSTADETVNDQTIKKCIGFAKRADCGGITMANLYAFRSTDPRGLLAAGDPVGPDNDHELVALAEASSLVIAAWGGSNPLVDGRAREDQVLRLLGPDVKCLGRTSDGHPRHPSRVPYAQLLIDFTRWSCNGCGSTEAERQYDGGYVCLQCVEKEFAQHG